MKLLHQPTYQVERYAGDWKDLKREGWYHMIDRTIPTLAILFARRWKTWLHTYMCKRGKWFFFNSYFLILPFHSFNGCVLFFDGMRIGHIFFVYVFLVYWIIFKMWSRLFYWSQPFWFISYWEMRMGDIVPKDGISWILLFLLERICNKNKMYYF